MTALRLLPEPSPTEWEGGNPDRVLDEDVQEKTRSRREVHPNSMHPELLWRAATRSGADSSHRLVSCRLQREWSDSTERKEIRISEKRNRESGGGREKAVFRCA